MNYKGQTLINEQARFSVRELKSISALLDKNVSDPDNKVYFWQIYYKYRTRYILSFLIISCLITFVVFLVVMYYWYDKIPDSLSNGVVLIIAILLWIIGIYFLALVIWKQYCIVDIQMVKDLIELFYLDKKVEKKS